MSRKIMFSAVLVVFSALLLPPSRPVVLDEGFLPRNDLRISIGSFEDKGVTKMEFDQVLDRVQAVYGPIIAARGGKLVIDRLWDESSAT
jgi:hypothetical protein